MSKTYLNPREAMEMLGLKSIKTIYGMIKSGKLKATNLSSGTRKTWRIHINDLNGINRMNDE